MVNFYDKNNYTELKEELKNILKTSKLIHRVEDNGDYLKLFTEILLGKSNDYLNLYIIFEDEGVSISDSNNIFAVLDDYYTVEDDMLAEIGNAVDLDYEDYRFTKWITPETVLQELAKYEMVVNAIINLNNNQ